MAAAEGEQKALHAAIEELRAERLAIAQTLLNVASVAEEVKNTAHKAIGAAMRQSLVGASETATKALNEAVRPLIGQIAGAAQSASVAEASLRRASQWFAWKWTALAAVGLASVCLVAYGALAWQNSQITDLHNEAAALSANIAVLKAQGGLITTSNCAGKLCIKVYTNQTYGNDRAGERFMIPVGY
ncbi:MAG: hypothetical protein E6Q61_02105 [Nitrosomonas sp.]|nr:MAG: hypothetical protein E6Q61_02105 [Nitrosomonas sp.]